MHGESPPRSFEVAVAPRLRQPLHSFLAGTSDRLAGELARLVSSCDALLQPGLRRDCDTAAGFFRCGPSAIRDLRVRHGIRQQVLSRADFERLIRDEMEAVAGPFDVLAVDEGAPALLGARRARRRAIESMLQQLEAAAEFH